MWVTVANSAYTSSKSSYSYNLTTWTASPNENTVMGQPSCVAYDGKMWVAGGQPATGASLAYSNDGVNWTASVNGNSIISADVNGIAGNGSRWVAVGNGTNQIAYSDDGITWTGAGNSFFASSGFAVAWNGSYWLAGGGINGFVSGTRIYYSTDGITWTPRTTPSIFSAVISFAWNGSVWVAGGAKGAASGTKPMAYSYDSITWTQVLGPTIFNSTAAYVVWGQSTGYFVASGSLVPEEVAYSADGITWAGSPSGNSLFPNYPALASNPEVIVGGAGTTLGYTNNGTTWSSISYSGGITWWDAIASN
jgi:hypothetical protein